MISLTELAVVKQKLYLAIKQTFEEHDYTIFDFNITEKPRVLNYSLNWFFGVVIKLNLKFKR